MKLDSRHNSSWIQARRGLAPVEFVLWLPVLLLVAALMINFGTMAGWRLRGEVVSRDSAWRVRWPRTGANEPRPDATTWPAGAPMTVEADEPLAGLDIPAIQHPVARGPLPNGFEVRPLLDPDDRGATQGQAQIIRPYPMISRLGDYNSGEIKNSTVDQLWQVAQMGIPTNKTRRIPYLYMLPKAAAEYPQAFLAAVQALFNMPHFDALVVLDRDEDVRRYIGHYVDFHPRIRADMAETDPAVVRRRKITTDARLVDTLDRNGNVVLGAISRLPRSMTDFFLNMYQAAIQDLQARLNQMRSEMAQLPNHVRDLQRLQSQLPALLNRLRNDLNSVPPPSPQQADAIRQQIAANEQRLQSLPGEIQAAQDRLAALPGLIAEAQNQLPELDAKIEQLQAYHARLPEIEDGLRDRAAAAIAR